MQISYTEGRYTVTANGDTLKATVEQLSELQEFISHVSSCTVEKKSSDKIHLRVREVEDKTKKGKTYKYYEAVCMEDGELKWYKLGLGQTNEGGGLFPKRKDESGAYLPNRGWQKFEKQAEDK